MPHCCWGLCNSDSKYGSQSKRPREDMVGVFFVPFPKPKSQLQKCLKWIKLCGNAKLTGPEVITQNYYVCSKHFVDPCGPTLEHPDPVPAVGGDIERSRILKMYRKRPPPKSRELQPKKETTVSDEDDLPQDNRGHHVDSAPVSSTSAASAAEGHVTSCAESLTDLRMSTDLIYYSDEHLENEKAFPHKLVCYDVTRDDKSCNFYTGSLIFITSDTIR